MKFHSYRYIIWQCDIRDKNKQNIEKLIDNTKSINS